MVCNAMDGIIVWNQSVYSVINKYMSSEMLVTVVLATLLTLAHSGSFTTGPRANLETYSFTGAAGATMLLVQLTFNPVAPPSYSTLMICKTSLAGVSNDIDDYKHLVPTSSTSYDYENGNLGQKQSVEMTGLSASDNVYCNVINFYDQAYSYTVNYIEKTTRTNLCEPGATANPTNIYCDSCSPLKAQGAFCKYTPFSLSAEDQATFVINPGAYLPIIIAGNERKMDVYYQTDTAGTMMFVQFEQFEGEMAGWINHVQNGFFKLSSASSQYYVGVTSSNKNVLVGVINQDSGPITFSIKYSLGESEVSVLVIVLGVLGGILLVALIIAAVFIIRRMSSDEGQVHPRPLQVMRSERLKGPENLSPQEIEQYFPSVTFNTLRNQEQSSSNQLQPSMSNVKDSIDRDCVICLNPIQDTDRMKVTYCKHIFHDHCLVQWFAKQRNCPYCRQEYAKKQTIEHYQKVLKQNGKTFMMGNQLARAIFKAKLTTSKVEIEDIKDDVQDI